MYTQFTVTEMYDEEMNPINSAPHARQTIYIKVPAPAPKRSILRRAETPCAVE
jgi:putative protease